MDEVGRFFLIATFSSLYSEDRIRYGDADDDEWD